MFWLILIKVLAITEVCQSYTINQPSYSHDGKYFKPNISQVIPTAAAGGGDSSRKYGLRKFPNSTTNKSIIASKSKPTNLEKPVANSDKQQPYESFLKPRLLPLILPYKSGIVSNILSQSQSSVLTYKEPVYSNIYPVKYEYHSPLYCGQQETATALVALESNAKPVTAATSKTEVLHQPQKPLKLKYNLTQPSINYNNKVYRLKKAIANQSYTSTQYPHFMRKQRNLNENHYDDKLMKLNEHNFTQIRDDNKDDVLNFSTTAYLMKHPSSSSHEIRYLHDIFLNYPKSHHVNYGHIQLSPYLFEKRFESLKAGNRYKGEVIWLDNTGGYSQHYWNMAQGKL